MMLCEYVCVCARARADFVPLQLLDTTVNP